MPNGNDAGPEWGTNKVMPKATKDDTNASARRSVRRASTSKASTNMRRAMRRVVHRQIPDGMTETVHIDSWGRKFAVYVSEGMDPSCGHLIGPMPLDSLELPMDVMIRLHNELYERRLLTESDVLQRPQDVAGALAAAYQVDVQTIQGLYHKY